MSYQVTSSEYKLPTRSEHDLAQFYAIIGCATAFVALITALILTGTMLEKSSLSDYVPFYRFLFDTDLAAIAKLGSGAKDRLTMELFLGMAWGWFTLTGAVGSFAAVQLYLERDMGDRTSRGITHVWEHDLSSQYWAWGCLFAILALATLWFLGRTAFDVIFLPLWPQIIVGKLLWRFVGFAAGTFVVALMSSGIIVAMLEQKRRR